MSEEQIAVLAAFLTEPAMQGIYLGLIIAAILVMTAFLAVVSSGD